MHTSILLLRGINVGGRNKLPMKEFVEQLHLLKLRNVQTYIQSGNAIFQSTRKPAANLGAKIATALEKSHGFRPSVLVISKSKFKAAMDGNPFLDVVEDPKTLHLFFLSQPAKKADLKAIDNAKTSTENTKLTDDAFYLHSPDGFARSKLASSVEKHLGVPSTARNWRTVEKIWDMVDST